MLIEARRRTLRGTKGEIMFQTLIWATDGSETADRALPFVRSFAAPGAQVYAVHVREIMVGPGAAYPVYADEPDLQERIAGQVAELRAEGLDAHLRVLTAASGNAARQIADVARDVDAELILVGTRGYGRVAGLLLGSTTQGLLHAGVCPVLAVPPLAAAGQDERELETAVTS
jgi:nucleotide-binding universal stress UspA family protein